MIVYKIKILFDKRLFSMHLLAFQKNKFLFDKSLKNETVDRFSRKIGWKKPEMKGQKQSEQIEEAEGT